MRWMIYENVENGNRKKCRKWKINFILAQFYVVLLLNKYHDYQFYIFNCNLGYFSLKQLVYDKKINFRYFVPRHFFGWKNSADLPKMTFDSLSNYCFWQYVCSPWDVYIIVLQIAVVKFYSRLQNWRLIATHSQKAFGIHPEFVKWRGNSFVK